MIVACNAARYILVDVLKRNKKTTIYLHFNFVSSTFAAEAALFFNAHICIARDSHKNIETIHICPFWFFFSLTFKTQLNKNNNKNYQL